MALEPTLPGAEPTPLDPSSPRAHANRGNGLFHADSSFNPRRASFSLLRAAQLPPPETGGDTLFADSRTAAEELDAELLALLAQRDLVGAHSMANSRKLGSPAFFADLDPGVYPMVRHRILQRHEPSGRMNLYVGAHLHHVEEAPPGDKAVGEEIRDSWALVQKLNAHATREKYVVAVLGMILLIWSFGIIVPCCIARGRGRLRASLFGIFAGLRSMMIRRPRGD